ncbi:MAG: hypothetical protein IAE89_13305 [Anaerolineae bacterium]|nr:hypothetical protein [Anaerolineae bacterium]
MSVIQPPEPIEPEQARAILDQAMNERLGEDWQDEYSGWLLVTANDFMARVTKRGKNVDFLVDLLGNVTVEEKDLSDTQSSGRLIVIMLFFLAIGIAYLFARAVGWL